MTVYCGPVFWILALLALVALVTYFERLVDLRRARINYQDFLKGVINVLDSGNDEEALSICEDTLSPIAGVVSTAIRQRRSSERVLREAVDAQGRSEIGRLDRRMAVISIIAQIAPLTGLLGTVIGFVRTVMLANSSEIVVRAELMNGAMESFVVAAAGLVVSIAAVIMYGSLRVRLDRVVVDLEQAASQIVGYLLEGARE